MISQIVLPSHLFDWEHFVLFWYIRVLLMVTSVICHLNSLYLYDKLCFEKVHLVVLMKMLREHHHLLFPLSLFNA